MAQVTIMGFPPERNHVHISAPWTDMKETLTPVRGVLLITELPQADQN